MEYIAKMGEARTATAAIGALSRQGYLHMTKRKAPEGKRPVGRPTVYTEATALAICEHIVLKLSVREIAAKPDMPSEKTIWRWIATNVEFQQRYVRAKEAQADHLAEELLEIADDGRNDWMERQQGEETVVVADHEHIQRSRLRVDARKWLMSKMAPKRYGDKTETTLVGKDGGPIDVTLTPAEAYRKLKEG